MDRNTFITMRLRISMTKIAKLFGVTADKLKEGQLLQVHITSVEGRTVAILDDEVTLQ